VSQMSLVFACILNHEDFNGGHIHFHGDFLIRSLAIFVVFLSLNVSRMVLPTP